VGLILTIMNEQNLNTQPEAQEQMDSYTPEAPTTPDQDAPDCQDCPWKGNDQPQADGPDQPEPDDPERSDECQRTCKRHFWTELFRAVIKVSTVLLAAFGLSSFQSED